MNASDHATEAIVPFAGMAAAVAFVLDVGYAYAGSNEVLRDGLTAADVAVFDPVVLVGTVAAATIAAAVVSPFVWSLAADHLGDWSKRRRGILAGAVIGYATIPATFFVWGVFVSLTGGRSFQVVATATVGGVVLYPFYVGPLSIPAGALTGAVLAVRQGDSPPDGRHSGTERGL